MVSMKAMIIVIFQVLLLSGPTLALAQLPTVDLILNIGDAAEAGQLTGSFTITRTGETSQALDVIVVVSGSADQFNDYNASNLIHYSPPNYRLQIPGGQSSISSTITPILDNLVEGPESAIFTLQPTVNYTLGT